VHSAARRHHTAQLARYMLQFLYNGMKMASSDILTYFRHFYSLLAVDTVIEMGIPSRFTLILIDASF